MTHKVVEPVATVTVPVGVLVGVMVSVTVELKVTACSSP